jgi:hypothetical protein
MMGVLAANLLHNNLWYMIPLIVAISLVYGATRHELMGPILLHAYRAGVWMAGFMAVIFVVILLVSWGL